MSVPFFARALFDYEAVESSELGVIAGDFLTVEEVNESGWCLVSPHRYRLQTVHSGHGMIQSRSAAITTYVFSDNNKSSLFSTVIDLLFQARKGDSNGWLPTDYVQRVRTH